MILQAFLIQEWTDMHCAITTANKFSGQEASLFRTSPVHLAPSGRKSTHQALYFSYTPFRWHLREDQCSCGLGKLSMREQ